MRISRRKSPTTTINASGHGHGGHDEMTCPQLCWFTEGYVVEMLWFFCRKILHCLVSTMGLKCQEKHASKDAVFALSFWHVLRSEMQQQHTQHLDLKQQDWCSRVHRKLLQFVNWKTIITIRNSESPNSLTLNGASIYHHATYHNILQCMYIYIYIYTHLHCKK